MPQAYNFKHVISTGVTTVSISQFGMLHGVVINQQDLTAGTVSTLQSATPHMMTIYDGTTTAASTATNIIGICMLSNSGIADYIYDCVYSSGLTLQVGSSAAPVDFTIIYT